MDFIPYSRQDIDETDIAAVTDLLRSDFLTQGPTGPVFEKAFANRHDVTHGIAVSNATAALHIGCVALGVGGDSLVWTSPISFVASANCALYCGAEVDFVDIDPDTRNISIDALREKLEKAETRGRLPDVVIPVDFSGVPCDLVELRELADRYGFKILQDASHATGASYRGRRIGGKWADATVFSFHAVKIVTSAEGGMIVTDDDDLAQRLRLLRSHGVTRDPALMQNESEGGWYYEQVDLGWNYRLTDLQSALGLSQLERMDGWRERREYLANRYDRLFAEAPLKLPLRWKNRTSSWHLYVVELEAASKVTRAEAFAGMRGAAIGVNVHYIPIHRQPYYEKMGFAAGSFPAAEDYYANALSLPLFPAMTDEEQERVAATLLHLVG